MEETEISVLLYVDENLIPSVANGVHLQSKFTPKGKMKRILGEAFSRSVLPLSMIKIDLSNLLKTKLEFAKEFGSMTPELLARFVRDEFKEPLTVRKTVEALHKRKKIAPGDAVLVTGKLVFPGINIPEDYDVLHPKNIQCEVAYLHGEKTVAAKLEEGDFFVPVFFPYESRYQVIFTNAYQVEVLGITKWTPPYNPGSLEMRPTQVLRAVALSGI